MAFFQLIFIWLYLYFFFFFFFAMHSDSDVAEYVSFQHYSLFHGSSSIFLKLLLWFLFLFFFKHLKLWSVSSLSWAQVISVVDWTSFFLWLFCNNIMYCIDKFFLTDLRCYLYHILNSHKCLVYFWTFKLYSNGLFLHSCTNVLLF